MNKIVFIGGVFDGQFKIVENLEPYLSLKYIPRVSVNLDFPLHSEIVKCHYYLAKLKTENKEFYFYRCQNLSLESAVEKLFSGYVR